MWRTSVSGDFITRDAAAEWAANQMPDTEAQTLLYARDAYLGRVKDEWSNRKTAAQRTAALLRLRVVEVL
ncbi:streptomycin 3'-adenylyltransferase [Sinorhizobium medicae]|nr:aminoglycoside adenylyltransferase domain-containing protein [Sinorhizobium medicae]TWA47553.1 streptomycin 3'-adenylyltransferase [Sinorhizobium medicae]